MCLLQFFWGYVSVKNWQNPMKSDNDITKIKRVTFFERVYTADCSRAMSDGGVAEKILDSSAGSSTVAAELSETQLSKLSSWQRAAVERLPAPGQRCLYNSWLAKRHPQGCSRIHTWK